MTKKTTQRRERRSQRHAAQSLLAHLPWRNLQNNMPPITRLDAEAEEKIHDASMRILEETGIAFMDEEALSMWAKAGAKVDHKRQNVRIDREMLLALVASAPTTFTWRARNPARNRIIGGNYINFSPHGGMVFAHDLDHGRRPGKMDDYINFLKMVQSCNLLHFSGEQLVTPHDVPVSIRHLQRSLAALTLTDKAFMEAAHGRIIPADALQMAKIVFGDGIVDSAEPVLGGIINASSPLRYDDRMIGGMLTYARANQITIITPFILAGAMSPISMAAAVAQQNAEALAGIAFTQLARRGAPVIYGGFATNIDMQSGSPAFGTPEGAWATIAGTQLARRYQIPYRSSGSLNTANVPDAQAASETMWSLWPAVLAHAHFINHAIGWLEGGLTVGFEKFVLDLENLAMFQHFLQDVEVSDATLALEMIDEVGIGGHHLGTPHTMERYRTEFYRPFLADRQNFEAWEESGVGNAATRANKLWKQLLDEYEQPPMDTAIHDELRDFVNKREQELVGVDLYT